MDEHNYEDEFCKDCGVVLDGDGKCQVCPPKDMELKEKVMIVARDSKDPSKVYEGFVEGLESIKNMKPVNMKLLNRIKNPNKVSGLRLVNKLGERAEIAYYAENDFINIFINGGSHNSRFMMNANDVDNLLNFLIKTKKEIFKALNLKSDRRLKQKEDEYWM